MATVASLARDWAGRTPNHVAMREKDFGIWQEYSWDQTWNLVLDAAHALLALDVEVGDRVSIHAEDRPEWVILDLAAVAVRGITVGLYPTNPAAEVEYLLTDSAANVHLAEDQEQVDKVLRVSIARLAAHDRVPRTPRSRRLRRQPAPGVGRVPRPRRQAPRRAPGRRRGAHGRGPTPTT